MYTIEPGDLILLRGRSLVSRFISFLIYTVFGIRRPWTHAGVAINKRYYLSAEAGGVDFMPIDEALGGAERWAIYRHDGLTYPEPHRWRLEQAMADQAVRYVGAGYDYALYILWFLRVCLVTAPLVWLIGQPFRDWLKREERNRWACSELAVQVYKNLGVRIGIRASHNAIPDDLYQIAESGGSWVQVASGGKWRGR